MADVPTRVVRDPVSLDNLWGNPDHWKLDGSYNCADDPRLLVRDRARVGWTLNIAHRHAQRIIWGFLLVIVASVIVIGWLAGRS